MLLVMSTCLQLKVLKVLYGYLVLLDIWDAIKIWVQDCVSIYYISHHKIQQDSEHQTWWKEVVEVGHGDKKDEPWWPKMKTREELIQTCSIIICTASNRLGPVSISYTLLYPSSEEGLTFREIPNSISI